MSGLLTNKQLSVLTLSLEHLTNELELLLTATESGAEPVKLKDNQGRLSRMDELHNQSILMANRNLTRNRLKAISQAKARLNDGSFGFCITCDEPIAYNRLVAYPEASKCISCQSEAES
jgi:DnaK suppressor protein